MWVSQPEPRSQPLLRLRGAVSAYLPALQPAEGGGGNLVGGARFIVLTKDLSRARALGAPSLAG